MSDTAVEYGRVLLEPSTERVQASRISEFITWVNAEKGASLREANYDDLWRWSVNHLDAFWESIIEHFELDVEGEYSAVVEGPVHRAMWFQGSSTNFGQHVLEKASTLEEAIIGIDESGNRQVHLRYGTEAVGGTSRCRHAG